MEEVDPGEGWPMHDKALEGKDETRIRDIYRSCDNPPYSCMHYCVDSLFKSWEVQSNKHA